MTDRLSIGAHVGRDDADRFTFREYRKIGTTRLSDERLPVGTRVATLEGEYVCAEPSRLAIDVAGNVYPVAESVFARSYELAGRDGRYTARLADVKNYELGLRERGAVELRIHIQSGQTTSSHHAADVRLAQPADTR